VTGAHAKPRTCSLAPKVRYLEPQNGFTIVELLVVIGIIALLLALLLPVLGKIRRHAHTTACLANLRQIGTALTNYASDNRSRVIPADLMPPDPYKATLRLGNWATILVTQGYLTAPDAGVAGSDPTRSVLHCPDGLDLDGFANDAYNAQRTDAVQAGYWRRQELLLLPNGDTVPGITVLTWYGINSDFIGADYPSFRYPSDTGLNTLHNFSQLQHSSELAMVYDGFFQHNGKANLLGHARHEKGTITNYLFADGHAQSVRTAELPKSLDPADLATVRFPKFKLNQD
jgi:prepilin-type N-terminal cleavage/methylation domain-containing protein/prepilin-type processing-associated H-X9-DG protein